MSVHSRVRAMIQVHLEHTGEKPKVLVVDSLVHDQLKWESREALEAFDNSTGDLISIFGIPVVLLKNALVVT